MAWLPPDLADLHPTSIGRAVPGGSLHLAPLDDAVEGVEDGVGELVYTGANVMMGYAESPGDLALPPMEPVLHTGDLARELGDGLFEVVGRLKRITKVFGLRINLDDVEKHLAAADLPARVVGTDDALVVFVTSRRHRDRAREVAATACGLPLWVVHVEAARRMPLTANGKPDYAALSQLAGRTPAQRDKRPRVVDPEDVRQLYARILNRPEATVADSFVGLGADSLSYVEMSVRLGERIDPLPQDWHTRSIASLASGGQRQRWGRALDTNVLLRALAIVAILGSHSEAWVLLGGAHLLLALAGYSFARFHLAAGRRPPWRRIGWALTAIAVPACLWLAGVASTTGEYTWRTVVFLNWTRGSTAWDDQWRFWFLEALVWTLVALAAALSVRRVRAFEARHPFAVAAVVLLATLVVRWSLVGVTADDEQKYALANVLWVFALGWLMARSTSLRQRVLTSVAVAGSFLGFFADPQREWFIIVGLLVVLWVPQVRVPRLVATVIGSVSAASLAIYVTQWQVYPHLEVDHPYLAVLASIVVGIAYHRASKPVMARLRS
jgi:acyl carrier protein